MKNLVEMSKYELLEVVDTTTSVEVLKEIVNTTECNISVVRECIMKLIELKYDFSDSVFVVNSIETLKEFKDYCVLTFSVYKELIKYLNELKQEDNESEDTFYYAHSRLTLEEEIEINEEYKELRKKQEEDELV